MQKKIFLSLVIPTYNRKELLVENVAKVLKFDADDFEVVVIDDCSTDGTAEYLREKISDERLRIDRNEKNQGGFVSFVSGLYHAKGKYILHCSDRDVILAEKLPILYKTLKENLDIVFMRTSNDSDKEHSGLTIFEKGYDSLIHDPLNCHPTGAVFDGEILREKFKEEDYTKYAFTCFAERFLARAFALEGKTAFFRVGLYHNGSDYHVKKKLVSRVNGEGIEEKFYFHPDRSWVLFEESFRQVFTLLPIEFDEIQTRNYIKYTLDFLFGRLADFKKYRNDDVMWMHYNLVPRHVGFKEIIKFYKQYDRRLGSFLKKREFPSCAFDVYKHNKFRYFMYLCKADIMIELERIKQGKWPWSYKKYAVGSKV